MTWRWQIMSCPLTTPSLVLIEARFANLSFLYDRDPSTVVAGSDVRVRVRFPETERQFFDVGKFQVAEAFAHARRLQIEPIVEKDAGLRSPEVAAAVTLPAKVVAWCHANGEVVPDQLVEAIGTLETTPADVVVHDFRRRMDALLDD